MNKRKCTRNIYTHSQTHIKLPNFLKSVNHNISKKDHHDSNDDDDDVDELNKEIR